MTSINLTREEAQQRSDMVEVSHYDVALDLTGEEFFTSTTVVKFRVTKAGSTFIDLRGDELLEVRLMVRRCPPALMTRRTASHSRVCRWRSMSSRSWRRSATPAPARVCTASWTRWMVRPTSTPSSRLPTPSASSPALTSRI